MSAPRIRIFSDLHFGDPRSRLRELDALTPLLDGADEVVLNGDTLDTVTPDTLANQRAVREFFAAAGPRATFLCGNHDPDISTLNELSLADGRVWLTHGDVLFDHIAPWSYQAPDLIQRLAAIAASAPTDEAPDLETRFHRHRQACIGHMASPEHANSQRLGRMRRLQRTLFPPRRLFAILRAWRDTPHLAASLAEKHRPRAQVVIIGHTHRPGVWRSSGQNCITIINTGSFSRPLGGSFVELIDNHVRVVRIDANGSGFRPGQVIAELAIS